MTEIPVIDCINIAGDLHGLSDVALEKFTSEFGNALEDKGFVYLSNHGIDMIKIEKMHRLARQFFNLPLDIKRKYMKADFNTLTGYVGPGQKFKPIPDLKELWDISRTDSQDASKYPNEIPGFKQAIDDLWPECINLVQKLLRSIAIYLKLQNVDYFIDKHRGISNPYIKTNTQFRILYYYALYEMNQAGKIPKNSYRCGEHTDGDTITLLFQDMVGGLEVKNKNNEWIQAEPISNTILINTGQLLEIWSGGRLRATPHRIRITEDEKLLRNSRQSFIYFVDPDWEAMLEPIVPVLPGKECLIKDTPITIRDFTNKLYVAYMSK